MYFLNSENIVQFIDPLMDWNGLEDNAAVLGKALKMGKLHSSTRFLFTACILHSTDPQFYSALCFLAADPSLEFNCNLIGSSRL